MYWMTKGLIPVWVVSFTSISFVSLYGFMLDTGTSVYEELLRVKMSVSMIQNSELEHMKRM